MLVLRYVSSLDDREETDGSKESGTVHGKAIGKLVAPARALSGRQENKAIGIDGLVGIRTEILGAVG